MNTKRGEITIIVLIIIVVGLAGAVYLFSNILNKGEENTEIGITPTATSVPEITIKPTKENVASTSTPVPASPTLTPANPYTGWNDCSNNGLMLLIKTPASWSCESKEINSNQGFITIKGNNFTWEIENTGRGFGCNLAPNCTHTEVYDNDLITLYLLTRNGQDQYIFGTFKDNTDERSYGGIYITYEGIQDRKMTEEEEDTLFKMLDSMVRR